MERTITTQTKSMRARVANRSNTIDANLKGEVERGEIGSNGKNVGNLMGFVRSLWQFY